MSKAIIEAKTAIAVTEEEHDNAEEPDSGSRSRNWAFTWNNYPEDHEKTLKEYVDSKMLKAIGWQREVAPTTGTPHLQGWLITPSHKSFKQIKEMIDPKIRYSQMRKCLERNISYCSKIRTKDGAYIEYGDVPMTRKEQGQIGKMYISNHGDVWSHLIEDIKSGMTKKEAVAKYPDMHGMYTKGFNEKFELFAPKPKFNINQKYQNLFQWQAELLEIIGNEPNARSVHWIWSKEGAVGKSDMLKHLVSVNGFEPMQNGPTRDLACAWKGGSVAFDYSRDEQSNGAINYTIIEHMKNGLVFSPKYESTTKMSDDFKPIFVVCFSNQPPDISKLSPDRWEIFRINNDANKSWTKQTLAEAALQV